MASQKERIVLQASIFPGGASWYQGGSQRHWPLHLWKLHISFTCSWGRFQFWKLSFFRWTLRETSRCPWKTSLENCLATLCRDARQNGGGRVGITPIHSHPTNFSAKQAGFLFIQRHLFQRTASNPKVKYKANMYIYIYVCTHWIEIEFSCIKPSRHGWNRYNRLVILGDKQGRQQGEGISLLTYIYICFMSYIIYIYIYIYVWYTHTAILWGLKMPEKQKVDSCWARSFEVQKLHQISWATMQRLRHAKNLFWIEVGGWIMWCFQVWKWDSTLNLQ